MPLALLSQLDNPPQITKKTTGRHEFAHFFGATSDGFVIVSTLMQPQIQDVLGELAEVRSRLEAERAEILTRLAGINAALGEPTRRVATRTPRKRSPYRKAPGTLEDLIVEVTTPAPLTPLEILEAVTKAGYVTTAPEPLKIIANVLARSAKLKKAGKGKFAPV